MREMTSNAGLLDEQLYSTLVNTIRGIAWEADPVTFRFFFVSPHAERILGYPTERWLDEPDFWRNHTHPEDLEWVSAHCRDASANERDHELE